MDRNFETHLELSSAKTAQSGTHLVVWPETAITQGYLDSEIAREKIQNMLQGYNGEAHLLTGALRYNKERDYFNSIVNVNAKGAVQSIYDKFHLVPFGEYIPFQNLIPIKTVSQFSGFKKGAESKTDLFQKDSLTSPLHERISKKSMDKTTINLAILITQLGFLLFICSVSHRKYRINRKN